MVATYELDDMNFGSRLVVWLLVAHNGGWEDPTSATRIYFLYFPSMGHILLCRHHLDDMKLPPLMQNVSDVMGFDTPFDLQWPCTTWDFTFFFGIFVF